jgi:hypothetical protein
MWCGIGEELLCAKGKWDCLSSADGGVRTERVARGYIIFFWRLRKPQ